MKKTKKSPEKRNIIRTDVRAGAATSKKCRRSRRDTQGGSKLRTGVSSGSNKLFVGGLC